MKTRIVSALFGALLAASLSVQAHEMRHFTVGSPGKAGEVTKIIHVQATDQMRLVFDRQDIREGDVVKFIITNTGVMLHEFGIDDEAGQKAHQQEMMQMPNMTHDDPNVVSLKPGETRTLIWRFKGMRQHDVIFACNVPGHYQAGMSVRLTVQK
ncbi:MAG: hypothetical protein JO171_06165 [Paludibacterium sp.]|uniref:cupredoxin domain-containing protein n=1 Tax=Paludibacterium sp. TaxID=1917523 RepID=UPI0025D2A672|nr:hypothetical protein [Paludibacterium sp.]MBV8046716.1 hypothetical protein [Paludibacterium sp.]